MRTKKVRAIKEPLSVIGLGCWAIGGSQVWSGSDDAHSASTITRAVELGVNFFDVAPVYGFGHAETVLGRALKDAGRRQDVLIATKCGLTWDDEHRITRDLRPESVRAEIDSSLRRLQTDYVDLYQLHWPDPNVPLEDTLGELERLVQTGKIRYIGLTNFSRPQLDQALSLTHVASWQGLYNLFERNPRSYHSIPLEYRTEEEVLPLCRQHGLALLPYSPLFQGLLTGTFDADTVFRDNDVRSQNPKLNGDRFRQRVAAAEELRELAESAGHPLSHLALSWLIQNEAVTSIIAGAQNVDHVEENAAAAEWNPGDALFSEVERILDKHQIID